MKIPNFVATTAYPASGKSTITKYLESELGFARFSGDEALKKDYGGDGWFENMPEEQKREVLERMYKDMQDVVHEGKNTVLDTTLYNNKWRKDVFTGIHAPCEKHLVWIRTGPELQKRIIESRIKSGQWKADDSSPIGTWKNKMGWEDPGSSNGYNLIVYENNTPSDLRLIKSELRKRFL